MKFDKYDNDSLINFYIENGLEFDERKKYFENNIRSFALLENENIILALEDMKTHTITLRVLGNYAKK